MNRDALPVWYSSNAPNWGEFNQPCFSSTFLHGHIPLTCVFFFSSSSLADEVNKKGKDWLLTLNLLLNWDFSNVQTFQLNSYFFRNSVQRSSSANKYSMQPCYNGRRPTWQYGGQCRQRWNERSEDVWCQKSEISALHHNLAGAALQLPSC